jgi:hypothetical protein
MKAVHWISTVSIALVMLFATQYIGSEPKRKPGTTISMFPCEVRTRPTALAPRSNEAHLDDTHLLEFMLRKYRQLHPAEQQAFLLAVAPRPRTSSAPQDSLTEVLYWEQVVKPMFPQTLKIGVEILQWDYLGTSMKCHDLEKKETLRQTVERLVVLPQSIMKDGRTVTMCLKEAMGDWRTIVPAAVHAVQLHGLGGGTDVYEFGVSFGFSVVELWQSLRPRHLWGFDSFAGLPQADVNSQGVWSAGEYGSDPRVPLTKMLGELNVGWVPGWYNESVAPSKDAQVDARGMRPAMYVDMDVDYFNSTIDTMEFLLRNHLIVPGTVIGYDDWWILPCSEAHFREGPLESGEGLAHVQLTKKYDIEFQCIGGLCRFPSIRECDPYHHWGAVFVVLSIGKGRATHGFEMSTEELFKFKTTDVRCWKGGNPLRDLGFERWMLERQS